MFLVDPGGPHFQEGVDRMKRLTPLFIIAFASVPQSPRCPSTGLQRCKSFKSLYQAAAAFRQSTAALFTG
jgi:hypothetical protein